MFEHFSPAETLIPFTIPIWVNGGGLYSYINLKIAVAPTAEIAIGIKTIDLKKASPLLSRSESQPTIRPINNVKKTTKKYANENFGSRIALLYLDVDNYDGTLEILKNLYKKMAKGGIIVFDEYALQGHGESDAVDEFFKNKKIKLKSFSWANSPTAYAVIK